jgi:hypothetical protein
VAIDATDDPDALESSQARMTNLPSSPCLGVFVAIDVVDDPDAPQSRRRFGAAEQFTKY